MRDKMKDDANYSEVIDEETTIGDTIVSPLYPLNDNASTLRQKAIDQMPSRKIDKPPVYLRSSPMAPTKPIRTVRYGTNIVCNVSLRNQRNSISAPNTYQECDVCDGGNENNPLLLEQHAISIAKELEKDDKFMEGNPAAKQLRMNVLRDMPQCLYVKRAIKLQLEKSVSKSKPKPISLYKLIKYRVANSYDKVNTSINNFKYNYELWYSTLKEIEGSYGSGVATYFRFHRSIFIMNLMLVAVAFILITLPQYLSNENGSSQGEWKLLDFLTGEGFLKESLMYYGNYANHTIVLYNFAYYNLPLAYFLTMVFLYMICFLGISLDMAQSYRRNFIEASGGLKNVFAHKVFCGWDFSIVTEKTATLKHQTVFKELRELLSEDCKIKQTSTLTENFWTICIRTTINVLVAFLLILTAISMWTLLDKYHDTKIELLTNAPAPLILDDKQGFALLTALCVTVFMNVFPKVFACFAPYEKYSSPRFSLYVTLVRTFLLGTIIVTVLIFYWLSQTSQECWETSLGQEVYRLIVMDFLFSFFVSFSFRGFQYLIYTKVWAGIGVPQFDIAHNSLDLIYSQTLFWVGFYFSPLLPLVIVLKMFCQFYLQRCAVLYFCLPANKSWRAAQTNTVFLVMAFISLLCVLIVYAYILTKVPTTNCGPFKEYEYFYQMILQGIFQLKRENTFFKLIMYLTKPGIVGGILIGMIGWVYYLRAKSNAQIQMVSILREMLLFEAKDKEFLLGSITKVSDAEWITSIPSPILRKNSNWDNISAWRQARSDEDVTESINPNNNLYAFRSRHRLQQL